MTRSPVTSTQTFGAGDAYLGSGTYPDWTQLNSALAGQIKVLSGHFVGENSNSPEGGDNTAAAFWSGAGTFTDDQYATCTIADASNIATTYGTGVLCRGSGSGGTRTYFAAYAYSAFGSTNLITRLFKIVNGTYTSIATADAPWATGDTLTLECSGTSGAITLTVYRNDVEIVAMTQTTATGPNTGVPGLLAGDDGFAPDGTGDDWIGGNLVGDGGGETLMGAQCL